MVGTGTLMLCSYTQTSDTLCDLGELEKHNMRPSSLVSS